MKHINALGLKNHRCHLFTWWRFIVKCFNGLTLKNLQTSEYRYDEVLESNLNILKFTVALRRERWHTIWWKIEDVIVFKWWLKKCGVSTSSSLSDSVFEYLFSFSYEMSGQKSSWTQSSKINYFISFQRIKIILIFYKYLSLNFFFTST